MLLWGFLSFKAGKWGVRYARGVSVGSVWRNCCVMFYRRNKRPQSLFCHIAVPQKLQLIENYPIGINIFFLVRVGVGYSYTCYCFYIGIPPLLGKHCIPMHFTLEIFLGNKLETYVNLCF